MPRKIVIIGPESTGKSTLTQGLAHHFGEPWVPEYAREYLEDLGRPYEFGDLLNIAKGQVAEEDRLLKQANNYLFCDTDLQVIQVWSGHKYGNVHPWILQQIAQRPYDHYFLTSIDMPWEPDPQREHPEPAMRAYFFERYKLLLETANKPYVEVSGDQETRLDMAIHYIKANLGYSV